jgi:hypothetical protein
MVQIQPVNVWYNGQVIEAKYLNAYVINDNLSTFAQFWWGLYAEGTSPDSPGINVASANLTIAGQDYIDWNGNPDINAAAYTWIADQLGLTII